tara:strand:+ start:102 stop:1145 length:1044 start_codon:yes stop_codon:yes gene_type:complete
MAGKPLTDKQCLDALAAAERYGGISPAAKALGMNRSTFEGRVRAATTRFGEAEKNEDDDDVTLPEFPDEDISPDEILDHLSKRWEKKQEHQQAKKWFDIKIKSDDPFGLVVVGDPHLGTHCNIPLLRRDVEIMSKTPGIGCVNIGDTTNNWGGRLIQLYAEEDISRSTERKLARWFLKEAEIPWLVWLHGNHDTMHSEFSTYLKAINVRQVPMLDWAAQFKLVFPSATVRVDASHNHKGTSVYNPLHGQKRASLWGEDADIFVAGHHHTWALSQEEDASGRVINFARCRGYKWHDEFGHRHGFTEENYGSSIMFVIDPTAAPNCRVKPFGDLKEAAEFLTWKRQNVA